MSGTARTAGALYGALDGLRSGETPAGLGLDPVRLAGQSAREIADRIALAIRPVDGTQDAEASRDAIARAFSELLAKTPDVDLTSLTQPDIDFVIECYLANDVSMRIALDIGNAVYANAPDPATAVRRMEEIKRYVRESIAASFRVRRDRGERLSRSATQKICSDVIRDTLDVFEEYTK